MAQSYSARSRAIEPFHVMALLARANQLQADGHDVIHLEIGEPDFTAPPLVQEAAERAIRRSDPLPRPPVGAPRDISIVQGPRDE